MWARKWRGGGTNQTMGQIRKSGTGIEGPQDGRRKVGMGGDFPLLYRLALNNRHYGEGTQTSAHTHIDTHTPRQTASRISNVY